MEIKTYAAKLLDYFSRKFVLSAVSLGTGFYLVLEGKNVLEYAGLVGVVLGFYSGANVVETVAAMRNAAVKTKTTGTPKVEVNVES